MYTATRLKVSSRRGRRPTCFSLTPGEIGDLTDRLSSSEPLLRPSSARQDDLMSRCPAFPVREQRAVPPSVSGGDRISPWKMSPGTPAWVQDPASPGALSFRETGYPDSSPHLAPPGPTGPTRRIVGARRRTC